MTWRREMKNLMIRFFCYLYNLDGQSWQTFWQIPLVFPVKASKAITVFTCTYCFKTHNSIYPLLLFYFIHGSLFIEHRYIKYYNWKNERCYVLSSVKPMCSACHKCGTNTIPTYDLPNTGQALHLLWATENSWRARPYTRFIFDMRLWHADQKYSFTTVLLHYLT